ncbi:MAG: SRPBCC family protein [Baekduia sp.]
MQPIEVAHSRTFPLGLEETYDAVIAMPLPEMFSRRHLLMPPISEVTDQTGTWGERIGQSRTIHTSDGGRMHEELTEVDAPNAFGYALSVIGGPMRALVAGVEGRWTFAPDGDGTRVTWAWKLTPKSGATRPLVRLIASNWPGYAAKALEQAELAALRAHVTRSGEPVA